MKVPLADLTAQHDGLRQELDRALSGVIDQAAFIGGPATKDFEQLFADRHGGGEVLGVGSGSEALNLALQALALEPGDEVITVPNTWISTLFAISHTGATPVLVDVDQSSYQMDVSQLESRISSRTKAVVVVHMHGHPAPVDEVIAICRPKGIRVIEDVAQSLDAELNGSKVGTFGDIACFSFYPSKPLGCIGDGGALLTSDDELATRCRVLADYGQVAKFRHTQIGWNSRLDSLQAAVLAAKMPYLDEWTNARRQHADAYRDRLAEHAVLVPVESENARHIYHLYVVQVDNRDPVLEALRDKGVMAQVHYPVPTHLQDCYQHLGHKLGDFPVAERQADRILSLPMYAELTEAQLDYVTEALISIVGGRA